MKHVVLRARCFHKGNETNIFLFFSPPPPFFVVFFFPDVGMGLEFVTRNPLPTLLSGGGRRLFLSPLDLFPFEVGLVFSLGPSFFFFLMSFSISSAPVFRRVFWRKTPFWLVFSKTPTQVLPPVKRGMFCPKIR